MSRRTIAGLLALGLMVVLMVFAATERVPYVRFKPGPTLNVLGDFDGKKILVVSGHKVYPDSGQLRMVTIYPDGPDFHMDLLTAMIGWLDPNTAMLPKDVVYKPTQSSKSVQQESAVEMTSSQDNATAAALTALGEKYTTAVAVTGVTKGGASVGLLEDGDILRSVNGKDVSDAAELIAAIQAVTPGDKVDVGYTRKGVEQDTSIVTRPIPKNETKSRINVSIGETFVFPFKVEVKLPETIGGPSAGMMFALSIYDVLTPGSLTGGKNVAGSGEITADGIVKPIGGIGQKLIGAQRDGARLFLVAKENCAEAIRSNYDRHKLRLVEVHTLAGAISALDTWRADPNAALPKCARG